MVVVPQPGAVRHSSGPFEWFPLLTISLIVYNVAAWGGRLMGGVESLEEGLAMGFIVPMPGSDAQWAVSVGDIFVWVSMILLFIEVVRATGTARSSILNHGLSILVFIVCLAEFLLFPQFATSVFFSITLMALLDVVAGFVISIITARRDFSVGA